MSSQRLINGITIVATVVIFTNVQASPATFSSYEFALDTLVALDGISDGDSRFILDPILPPLSATAGLTGANGNDSADAEAEAKFGELHASANAQSQSGSGTFSDAVSTAGFFAAFDKAGRYEFEINFESSRSTVVPGANSADAELSLIIENGFDVIIDTSFTLSETFQFDFELAENAEGFIEIELFSNAFAMSGAAGNTAITQFTLDYAPTPVPLPASLLLLLSGFGFVGSHRRKSEA